MERQTFRAKFYGELKSYMRIYFLKLRCEMNLTKDKMAELLLMDTRNYSDKENGKNLCNLTTFIALLSVCPNEQALLSDITDIYDKVINGDYYEEEN